MVTTTSQSSSFLKHFLTLTGQLSVLEAILKISCFDDILLAVTKVPKREKNLVQEVQTIYWLLAVNAATYAAGERSFSSAGPLKTWLRSTMDEERFSSLCLSRFSAIRVINVSRHFLRSLTRSLCSRYTLCALMTESLEQAIAA